MINEMYEGLLSNRAGYIKGIKKKTEPLSPREAYKKDDIKKYFSVADQLKEKYNM